MHGKHSKTRGFTLIELLIVIALIVVLMSIVFRIAGLGGESAARTVTVSKMQKVQNCLSGYYSAFGSYPPVKLHGSRSIYVRVNEAEGLDDLQIADESTGEYHEDGGRSLKWKQVNAACRSQPLVANFPYQPGSDGYIRDVSTICMQKHEDNETNRELYPAFIARKAYAYNFDGLAQNPGRFAGRKQFSDWGRIQLFRFGLMSYLLPRYQFMTGGHEAFYDGSFQQWDVNNEIPANPITGKKLPGWKEVRSMQKGNHREYGMSFNDILLQIPSQRACARWIANLEKIVSIGSPGLTPYKFFGVNVSDDMYIVMHGDNPGIPIFKAGGQQYSLDAMTIYDGWGREFYYYSPSPYQSYRLWSAGPNGKTFPPWITLDQLNSGDRATAGEWMIDDLIGLSN